MKSGNLLFGAFFCCQSGVCMVKKIVNLARKGLSYAGHLHEACHIGVQHIFQLVMKMLYDCLDSCRSYTRDKGQD